VLAQALCGPRPDRGDTRQVSPAAGDLVGAVRARDDQPVVAGRVDRVVGGALDLDQRTLDDLVPERLEPLHERPSLVPRPRDDHPHAPTPRGGSASPPTGTLATAGARVCAGCVS